MVEQDLMLVVLKLTYMITIGMIIGSVFWYAAKKNQKSKEVIEKVCPLMKAGRCPVHSEDRFASQEFAA